MLDQAQQMEKFEAELDELIDRVHGSGVSYWEILRTFLNVCQRLQMQADTEYHAKRGQRKKGD